MPTPARNQTYVIRLSKQAEALVSPVRQEIVDALAASGASTAAQVADALARRPDTLYYHIDALVKVGLLLEVGRTRAGKRFSAVYDVPGRPLKLAYENGLKAATITRIVRAALRLADRDFSRALPAEDSIVEGPVRNVWGGRIKGWVTQPQLAEINRLLTRLTQLVQRGRPRAGARQQSFTYVLTPVITRRSRASAAPAAPQHAKPRRSNSTNHSSAPHQPRKGTR